MRRVPALFLFLLGACVIAHAPSAAGQASPFAARKVRDLEQIVLPRIALKYRIPGMAVAVIQNRQLSGIARYGVRDIKSKAPVTNATVFEAGPLGEPVYAYSVLLLVPDGRLNIGAPLTAIDPLPYMRVLDPLTPAPAPATDPAYDPALGRVTAFALLDHTAGFPEWARNQHLKLQSSQPPKWSYSNEGYLFLQHAIEHLTGETTNDFAARSILRPAGMLRSGYIWQESFSADLASGYDRAGNLVPPHQFPHPVATATFYTSIQDYARFILNLLNSSEARQQHESAVTLMLNPAVAVDSSASLYWGLGVALEKGPDGVFFLGRNASPGFGCYFLASRETGNGVVVFTNSSNGLDAAEEIMAETLGGTHPLLKSEFMHIP